MASEREYAHQEPRFPSHSGARVWFITRASSPIGLALCTEALKHGDYVTAGLESVEIEQYTEPVSALRELVRTYNTDEEIKFKVVALDVRIISQCQAAVAEAVATFSCIDILCCLSSECVIGTVEELGQDHRTSSLVQAQFETNFFGPVNIIKAALPHLRSKSSGHILFLSAVTGHLGTPGLSVYCASQWAIEGYCDSLAYEVAPFSIKITIVQPNLEVNVLTNKITSAPPMQAYEEENNPAPLSRNILSSLLDKIENVAEPTAGDQLHSDTVTSIYPPLTHSMNSQIVEETVFAILAIAGHENPPARHIVGIEGIQAVKEKLKTVSEEMEDFAECSCLADVETDQLPAPG